MNPNAQEIVPGARAHLGETLNVGATTPLAVDKYPNPEWDLAWERLSLATG